MTYDYNEEGDLIEVSPGISSFYGGEISADTIEYLKTEGPGGIKAVQKKIEEARAEISKKYKEGDDEGRYAAINLLNKYQRNLDYIKQIEQGGMDYRYVGKLSNWHGTVAGADDFNEPEVIAYEKLYEKAVNIERIFGSRAGNTGCL